MFTTSSPKRRTTSQSCGQCACLACWEKCRFEPHFHDSSRDTTSHDVTSRRAQHFRTTSNLLAKRRANIMSHFTRYFGISSSRSQFLLLSLNVAFDHSARETAVKCYGIWVAKRARVSRVM